MSQTKIEISNLSDSVIAALAVPKITSITYPGDDTAANPTGGQEIILSGSGFSTGAIVNIAGVPVAVSSVVNGNTIAFNSPAKATGSYALSVINIDGGIAVFIANMEYSGVPAWSTPAGTLGTLYETDPLSAQLTAVSDSAVTYAVTSGLLPAGTSLNSATGALTGTTSSVASSTTYSFTVDAVDAEQQNTSRNFSATINPDVVSWSSPANETTYTNVTGDVFSQVLSATSAAGKTISYSANALPSGLSITGSTLSGTFSAATTSSSLITATAASTGKTATRTLNWSVVSPGIAATGGTITTVGGYKIHTFTTSGTFNVTSAPAGAVVEYLVVGGGGGGGGGGAGGAGGVLYGSLPTPVGNCTVTIGAGALNGYDSPGANSTIQVAGTTYTAFGGGKGTSYGFPPAQGGSGGSGGGAGNNNNNGGGAVAGGLKTQTTQGALTGYGNNGGAGGTSGNNPNYAGGGGGGAGAVGNPSSTSIYAGGAGGTGGAGMINPISGSTIGQLSGGQYYIAGGGGGGADNGSGLGGLGGAGRGLDQSYTTGSNATPNTGSGGGGGSRYVGSTGGGGSGVVIMRYQA